MKNSKYLKDSKLVLSEKINIDDLIKLLTEFKNDGYEEIELKEYPVGYDTTFGLFANQYDDIISK
jgi:hypothetical protein